MYKEIISTKKAAAAVGPYSQGVKVGNQIFISGQIPINPEMNQLAIGIVAQTRQSLENIKAIVEAAGGTLENIVKTTVLLKDMSDFSEMNAIYATYFKNAPPARACFEVSRLPKDAGIEIEAIAVL